MRVEFLGPCTQVQDRGSCPQGHGPHNWVHHGRDHGQTRRVLKSSAPHTPAGSDRLATLCFHACCSFFMAESSWQPVMGAAQRRRQRRLRSWWRHEQQSIAAALATVMHHSSGKVHTANGAPRSQKLATRPRRRWSTSRTTPYGDRRLRLRGERPAPLSEVAGPQRSDRTVRHSAGEAPLLVVPSRRGADGVDGTTVSFLLAENLKLQKEEEKERRRGASPPGDG